MLRLILGISLIIPAQSQLETLFDAYEAAFLEYTLIAPLELEPMNELVHEAAVAVEESMDKDAVVLFNAIGFLSEELGTVASSVPDEAQEPFYEATSTVVKMLAIARSQLDEK